MSARSKEPLSARVLDRLSRLLERAMPAIRWVERPARVLTVGGSLAVCLLAVLIVRGTDVESGLEWVALVVSVVVLAVPVVVLGLFVLTLRQIMELPEQLRSLPQTTKEQAARFAVAMTALRQPRRTGVRGSAAGLWHARGAIGELAGLIEPVVGIAGLLRLPFVLLVLFASLLVCVEIMLAFVAVVVLLVV